MVVATMVVATITNARDVNTAVDITITALATRSGCALHHARHVVSVTPRRSRDQELSRVWHSCQNDTVVIIVRDVATGRKDMVAILRSMILLQLQQMRSISSLQLRQMEETVFVAVATDRRKCLQSCNNIAVT